MNPSHKFEFTHINCYYSVGQHDEFVRRLLQIYAKVDESHQVYHILLYIASSRAEIIMVE